MVALTQVLRLDRLQAAQAFSDVFTRQFKVYTTRHGAFCIMHFKEALDFAHHVFEVTRLKAFDGFRVPMHWVARPNNIAAFSLHLPHQAG